MALARADRFAERDPNSVIRVFAFERVLLADRAFVNPNRLVVRLVDMRMKEPIAATSHAEGKLTFKHFVLLFSV